MNNSRKIILFVAVILVLVISAIIFSRSLFEVSRVESVSPSNRGQDARDTSSHESHVTSDSWPMFRGSQGLTGIAKGQLPDSLEILWRFKTDDAVKSSPVIDSNIVYVGSNDDNIYAIDLHSGQRIWAYKTDDSVEATPLYLDGTVYAGSAGGFFYAIDANKGSPREIMHEKTDISENKKYITRGELKWKYETGGQILGAANWTLSPDGKSIWIIVGSYDNFLYCIDSKSGKPVWKYESGSYINGSPAVEGKYTVFGGCDEVIHVISLINGKKIEGGSYIAASAAILDGQVYVGNYGNVFIKADIKNEKILWKYTGSDSPFFSSPVITDNCVVVGSRDEHVHCISRTDGKKIWTFATLGEVDSSPVVCDDKVIVGSNDGQVYMLRLSDGGKVWSYEIGQPITSSPAIAHGIVVIGCDDGYVYAFGTK
jgi:outer membrane protein assembly factor BamB